ARPAEEVMSPEPGSAFGKGGQHYTTDCPISRIGTAGREPSRNPRAERQRRTTILPGAVNKWVRLLTLRSLVSLSSLRRPGLAEPKVFADDRRPSVLSRDPFDPADIAGAH